MLKRHIVRQGGASLVEVLVTMLILAFALLGVAGLQAKTGLAEAESYQRDQALLVLQEMVEIIRANPSKAASYVIAGPLGTGDAQPADCTTIAAGPNQDLCNWSNALKGSSEKNAATNVGVMIGARGCITQVQTQNSALGVCTAGIYQVSVAWQGMSSTATPSLACGQGSYGADDRFRRLVAAQVSTATLACY